MSNTKGSVDVARFLSDLGLEQYLDAFVANDVSGDILADLDDQDLRDLGVAPMGHRKALLRAIQSLPLPNENGGDESTPKSRKVASQAEYTPQPREPAQPHRTMLDDLPVPSSDIERQPASQRIAEAHTVKELRQEHIDRFAADSNDFWSATYRRLDAPYSAFQGLKADTPSAWSYTCQRILRPALPNLNKVVLLKDEGLLAWTETGSALTSYRVLFTSEGVLHSIPLCALQAYGANTSDRIVYNRGERQIVINNIVSDLWVPELVNAIKNAREYEVLGETEQLLLSTTRYDLATAGLNLQFADIGFIHSESERRLDQQNPVIPTSQSKQLGWLPVLVFVGLLGTCMAVVSTSSSSSDDVAECKTICRAMVEAGFAKSSSCSKCASSSCAKCIVSSARADSVNRPEMRWGPASVYCSLHRGVCSSSW
jgi:hypothetical protein